MSQTEPDKHTATDSPQPGRVRVVVPGPLRQAFDYQPEKSVDYRSYPAGLRVEVPFGRRRVVGFVVDQLAEADAANATGTVLPLDQLKPLARRLDRQQPALDASLLALATRIADYYHHPLGDCLASLLPNLLTDPAASSDSPYQRRIWHISTHGLGLSPDALSRAPRQQALLQALRENRCGWSDDDLKQAGHKVTTARELAKKSLLESSLQDFVPESCEAIVSGNQQQPPLALNDEQQQALQQIRQGLGSFHPLLLEGVTGSGKTEVYLQAIEQVLQRGEQVLVLVPEIGLTPQTLARFAQRFNVQISVLHSGLGDRERLAGWLAAGRGDSQIVIGTRSAIFTPLVKPGLIVVDEEHDSSFKQHDGLRYHARDVALMRAQMDNVPVVLGSATPSLETLANAQRGKYQHAVLSQQASRAASAEIQFIDIRRAALHEGFSDTAIQAISQTLQAGEQVLVFINRRGFAPLLMCHDCGWSADCNNCDARLTLHRAARQLRCHHCDARQPLPPACPRCQSSQLQHLGEGTQRSAEALEALLPSTEIIRIDRDSVSSKHSLSIHIDRINQNQPLVVVGTQMLAKGHDFDKLNTVVVLNIDDALYQADFRAAEKTLQLLSQVAGRAGRRAGGGRVLIQTHLPDHPVLQQWADQRYQGISQQLLEEREARQLPPYAYMAMLRADSPDSQAASRFLSQLARATTAEQALDSQLVGPLPALMARRAGRHRAQLTLKNVNRSQLHRDVERLLQTAQHLKKPASLRWSIDIDPQEAM